MKTYLSYVQCLLFVGLLLTPHAAFAQSSGCPAQPHPSVFLEDPVLQIIPILAAVPETRASQARGVFAQQSIEVTYAPGQQVWLTSYLDGQQLQGLCADDLALVRAFPSGKTWEQDFRSPDRTTVFSYPAVNITELLVPGVNQITLTLTDLVPQGASSSEYVIVVAGSSFTPTPRPPTAIAVVPSPAPSVMPMATSAITNSIILRVVTEANTNPPANSFIRVSKVGAFSSPFPRSQWCLGALVVLCITLLLLGWRHRSPRLILPGLITLLKDGQMMGMWDLSSIGKAIVVLGGKGADMVLPGASVPAVVARIVAQATVDGRTQAVWELLDPADPEVVLERQTLEHGDELLVFKNIRLEYSRYEAETGTFLEGEVIHV